MLGWKFGYGADIQRKKWEERLEQFPEVYDKLLNLQSVLFLGETQYKTLLPNGFRMFLPMTDDPYAYEVLNRIIVARTFICNDGDISDSLLLGEVSNLQTEVSSKYENISEIPFEGVIDLIISDEIFIPELDPNI